MTKKISYDEAIQELETIVSEMEEDISIDQLSIQVKRATELIDICRKKLLKTETEVNKILHKEEEE
ncbi:MAG: exodeoxyribonuclease VII small subunit [Bacteroidetes bacterium]|nr:MAG: exodeoxyribonuclease VII small subunit [Bacteroidota bacterium]